MTSVVERAGTLRGRDFLSAADLSADDVERIHERAAALKGELADAPHAEHDGDPRYDDSQQSQPVHAQPPRSW